MTMTKTYSVTMTTEGWTEEQLNFLVERAADAIAKRVDNGSGFELTVRDETNRLLADYASEAADDAEETES